jgi:hypothetical protein
VLDVPVTSRVLTCVCIRTLPNNATVETRNNSLHFIHTTAYILKKIKSKRKAIPMRGSGDTLSYETLRLPHLLDNRLTDGGEGVSLLAGRDLLPKKSPGTQFCHRLSQPITSFGAVNGTKIRA